jgi:hypothetical protein
MMKFPWREKGTWMDSGIAMCDASEIDNTFCLDICTKSGGYYIIAPFDLNNRI